MIDNISSKIDDYTDKFTAILKSSTHDDLYNSIVNTPFKFKEFAVPLGLGIMVLLIENPKTRTVDRIALSETDQAKGAVDYSAKPFHELNIPMTAKDNIIVSTIKSGRWHQTDDWQYLFNPVLTPEDARFNQAGAAISCSIVYPLESTPKGALIFSYFKPIWEIEESHHDFMRKYSQKVSSIF